MRRFAYHTNWEPTSIWERMYDSAALDDILFPFLFSAAAAIMVVFERMNFFFLLSRDDVPNNYMAFRSL